MASARRESQRINALLRAERKAANSPKPCPTLRAGRGATPRQSPGRCVHRVVGHVLSTHRCAHHRRTWRGPWHALWRWESRTDYAEAHGREAPVVERGHADQARHNARWETKAESHSTSRWDRPDRSVQLEHTRVTSSAMPRASRRSETLTRVTRNGVGYGRHSAIGAFSGEVASVSRKTPTTN